MLHFFGDQRYFGKVSQNKRYFGKVSQNLLILYFFGLPKQILEKSRWIELVNVLHFNEKKN